MPQRIFDTDKGPSKDPKEVPPRSLSLSNGDSRNLKGIVHSPSQGAQGREELILIRFECAAFVQGNKP